MANSFGRDILIQVPYPQTAADFYVEHLGFTVTSQEPILELRGEKINLYIDQGPSLAPVLEVFVPSVEAAKERLVAHRVALWSKMSPQPPNAIFAIRSD